MAEQLDPTAGRKHRVIHWNPDAGREQVNHQWTWKRVAAWSAGGLLGALVIAGAINRLAGLVFGQRISEMLSQRAVVAAVPGKPQDPGSAFITQAKAEQAHELASKAIAQLQRMPPDHPVQLQQMILMVKAFAEGETLLTHHDFAAAFSIFDTLNSDIDAFTKNVKLKAEVQQAYDKIVVRVKDLELARSLAPGTLEAAYEAAGAGRQLLNDGNFTGAKKIFDRGFGELNKAEQALGDFVKENLLKGAQALTKGQKDEAKKDFQAALEKSPGNEQALQGLKRAENIDRVYALLQQGEKFEAEKQYAQAAEAFQKAFALDAMSAAAQEGAARAARLEKETKFATARTAADEAVKRKDWQKAIGEFENALKVYPARSDVQAALRSAKESAHMESVQKAVAKGYAYENQHMWKEARDSYYETLQLEPEQAEAKEGYLRSGTVIRALLEYEKYVEAAEELANKAEFQAALRRFNDAMNAKPTYLEASDRVLQLRALLQQQSQPVEVTFKSDGRTWVSITNFKTPVQTESLTLRILPGDYEVIGRRKGFRDVKLLLQVRNGTPLPPVTVMCTVSTDRL